MKTIWKFPFKTTDLVSISMPEGAEILSVQTQYEQPCMWALVDPEAKKVTRKFETFGAGDPVNDPETKNFIATYQQKGGAMIFHIFEVQ
jgi:hypothetical protein